VTVVCTKINLGWKGLRERKVMSNLGISGCVTDATLFCFKTYQKVQLEETMVETVFKFG